jgi:hypothetical protein
MDNINSILNYYSFTYISLTYLLPLPYINQAQNIFIINTNWIWIYILLVTYIINLRYLTTYLLLSFSIHVQFMINYHSLIIYLNHITKKFMLLSLKWYSTWHKSNKLHLTNYQPVLLIFRLYKSSHILLFNYIHIILESYYHSFPFKLTFINN